MKNKLTSASGLLATLLLAVVMSSSTILKTPPSTCGAYTIFNELTCNAKISYTRLCNGSPCSGPTTTSLPANTNLVLPACACSGQCMVLVTLIDIGGNTAGLPLTVGGSVTGATYPTSNCPGSGTGNFNWTPSFTSIH